MDNKKKIGYGWLVKIIVVATVFSVLGILLLIVMSNVLQGEEERHSQWVILIIGGLVLIAVIAVIWIRRILADKQIREIELEVAMRSSSALTKKPATPEKKTEEPAPLPANVPSGMVGSLKKVSDEMKRMRTEQKHVVYSSLTKVCEDFSAYAMESGVNIDFEMARDVFATMASSRAVWIRSDSHTFAKDVAMTLKKYFGGVNRSIRVDAGLRNPRTLICIRIGGTQMETSLAEELYRAKYIPNSICVTTVENADVCDFTSAFSSFIESFRAPEGETSLTVDYNGTLKGLRFIENKQMSFPTNMWYLLVASEEKAKLPENSNEYSTELYVKGKDALAPVAESEQKTHNPISFAQFEELVSDALDTSTLSLDVWKKLDRLEEYLQAKLPFAISNPVARQIERYSAVYVVCGGDEGEALDKVLANKLLPMLFKYTKEEINHEGDTLSELLDSLFGMDNLPITHKVMTKYGMA